MRPEKDRLALALYTKNNNRINICVGLQEKRFTSIDFLTVSKDKNPLLAFSPMQIAAIGEHWSLVQFMLEKLAPALEDISNEDERRQMKLILSKVLLIAAFHDHADTVEPLSSIGADPNQVMIMSGKFKGCRPLHLAIYNQSKPLIKKLMDAGADQMVATVYMSSALDFAISLARRRDSSYWKLIPLLTPEIQIQSSNPDTVVKQQQAYARALLLAAIHDQLDVVQHLLLVKADPNMMVALNGKCVGYTALHFAYRNNNPEMVFRLLGAGADPEKKAKDGSTFRSLLGNHNPLLIKLINYPVDERRRAIKHLMDDCFDQMFPKKPLEQTSLSEQLSNMASSVRQTIFSFFTGGSARKTIEATQRQQRQQQQALEKAKGQNKESQKRIAHLEQVLIQSNQAENDASTLAHSSNTVFSSGRHRSMDITSDIDNGETSHQTSPNDG